MLWYITTWDILIMITFESILDPREKNPDRQKEKRLKCDCRWVNWCCREVSKREERERVKRREWREAMREAGKQTGRRKREIAASSGTENRKGGKGVDRNWSRWLEMGGRRQDGEEWRKKKTGYKKESRQDRQCWLQRTEREIRSNVAEDGKMPG